jgi:hypothetical protein
MRMKRFTAVNCCSSRFLVMYNHGMKVKRLRGEGTSECELNWLARGEW